MSVRGVLTPMEKSGGPRAAIVPPPPKPDGPVSAGPVFSVRAHNDGGASDAGENGVVRWWWVRHAPVPSREGYIVGQLDLPCDTSDMDSMVILADRLPVGATLLLSPMLRTQQTAQALEYAGALLNDPKEERGLIEQSFGLWEGRTWSDITGAGSDRDSSCEAFWKDPANGVPPGGESFEALVNRVRTCVSRWTRKVGSGDIVAIAHAGSIRAAIAVALDLPPAVALRLGIDPLSLTCLDYHSGSGWGVRCINELPP